MWLRIYHFKGYKICFSVQKIYIYQHKNQGLFRKITLSTKIRKNIVLVKKITLRTSMGKKKV